MTAPGNLRHLGEWYHGKPPKVISWRYVTVIYVIMLQGFRESLRMLYRLLFLNHVEPLSSERHWPGPLDAVGRSTASTRSHVWGLWSCSMSKMSQVCWRILQDPVAWRSNALLGSHGGLVRLDTVGKCLVRTFKGWRIQPPTFPFKTRPQEYEFGVLPNDIPILSLRYIYIYNFPVVRKPFRTALGCFGVYTCSPEICRYTFRLFRIRLRGKANKWIIMN